MKVLYLFLPVHPKCNTIGMRSMPPLALYYLATILEDNGIEVDIVDPSIISRSQYFDTNVEAKKFIGNLFDNKEYDAILFSATTGNWGVTKEMIQQIHEEFPNIPICVGGIHVSYFARYIITGMPYLIVVSCSRIEQILIGAGFGIQVVAAVFMVFISVLQQVNDCIAIYNAGHSVK